MSRTKHDSTDESKDELQLHRLIEDAQARPGISELMKVYGGWDVVDREVSRIEFQTQHSSVVTASDHTSTRSTDS